MCVRPSESGSVHLRTCKTSTTYQLITKRGSELFPSLKNRSCPILMLVIPAILTSQCLDKTCLKDMVLKHVEIPP